jgi:hypothetical protein
MFLVATSESFSNLTACITLTRMTIHLFFYQFVNIHACAFMVSYDEIFYCPPCGLVTYYFNLIACIAICWHAIPDLTFTALQYLVVEYCERNQWGRSWGATTSQEPWFWKDISRASSFEDNCFCKYFHLSCWKLLVLYFGCCCFQQCLLLMKTPNPFLGRIFIFSNKYFWFLCWSFVD